MNRSLHRFVLAAFILTGTAQLFAQTTDGAPDQDALAASSLRDSRIAWSIRPEGVRRSTDFGLTDQFIAAPTFDGRPVASLSLGQSDDVLVVLTDKGRLYRIAADGDVTALDHSTAGISLEPSGDDFCLVGDTATECFDPSGAPTLSAMPSLVHSHRTLHPEATASCSYTLTPSSVNMSSNGDSKVIRISSNCTARLYKEQASGLGISATSVAAGGSFTVTASYNPGGPRGFGVAIADSSNRVVAVLTILQIRPGNTFNLVNPSYQIVGSGVHTATFSWNGPGGCTPLTTGFANGGPSVRVAPSSIYWTVFSNTSSTPRLVTATAKGTYSNAFATIVQQAAGFF
jgi:hypothetical protein